MISRYDKPVCIRAGGDAPNQVDDFRNRFLTGNENFVLGIGFVPAGIDLVVVHINHLFAGEDAAEMVSIAVWGRSFPKSGAVNFGLEGSTMVSFFSKVDI